PRSRRDGMRRAHLCGFCGTDDERTGLAVAFLADGLREGSVCYLIASSAVRRVILKALGELAPAPDAIIQPGRLVPADYARATVAQYRYLEKEFERATRSGATSIRLVGDMRSFAKHVSHRAMTDFDAIHVAKLAARFPLLALCQYDLRKLSGIEVL